MSECAQVDKSCIIQLTSKLADLGQKILVFRHVGCMSDTTLGFFFFFFLFQRDASSFKTVRGGHSVDAADDARRRSKCCGGKNHVVYSSAHYPIGKRVMKE